MVIEPDSALERFNARGSQCPPPVSLKPKVNASRLPLRTGAISKLASSLDSDNKRPN